MTEVLYAPRQPDGHSYYQSSALRRSPPSTSSLFLDASPASSPKSSTITTTAPIESRPTLQAPATVSAARPPPLAPDGTESAPLACEAAPVAIEHVQHRSLNINTAIASPTPSVTTSEATSTAETPLPSPAYNDDTTDTASCTDTTISDSPLATPTISDDTAVKDAPSRQVDFLTHEWREEDIWASWRHIVNNRKIYGERSRLENASWRQWNKTKHNLRTVSPESLNWLKESDITWLYGPLKEASSYPISQNLSEQSSQISKNNSFINKKPILKKRTMSEVMLQQSISSSSLVREAATTALFSPRRHPRRSDASSEFSESKLPSEVPSRDQDYFTSRSSSFCDTPSEKKHIRFDNVVEQCIAVDHKDLGHDEESEDERDFHRDGSSNSSDDDGLIMKRKRHLDHPRPVRPTGSRSNSHSRRIIETLPATTLKYRTDSPDIPEQAQHHTFGRGWNPASRVSPRASQETLRPSNPSANFLLAEEDDHDADDSDSSWRFGQDNPKSSLGHSSGRGRHGGHGSRTRSHTPHPHGDDNDDYHFQGMRRTGSGMFMPEDEEETAATGILGRVSDTINTARDIAHVIWTVGWRT